MKITNKQKLWVYNITIFIKRRWWNNSNEAFKYKIDNYKWFYQVITIDLIM